MSWFKSLFNFMPQQCSPQCGNLIEELEEAADQNKNLRRELHIRNDQIIILTRRLEDMSTLNRDYEREIDILRDCLKTAESKAYRHPRKQKFTKKDKQKFSKISNNVAESVINEEGNG